VEIGVQRQGPQDRQLQVGEGSLPLVVDVYEVEAVDVIYQVPGQEEAVEGAVVCVEPEEGGQALGIGPVR
jgi:hypothetical protein